MTLALYRARLQEKVCTPALNVNHAVDVADFEVRELGVPRSGGVKRHQEGATEGSTHGLDQSWDFFLAQDRRQVKCSLGIASFGNAPGLLRREAAEEFYSTHKTKASAKRLVSPIFSRSAPESNPLPLDGTAFHPDAALRGTTLVAG